MFRDVKSRVSFPDLEQRVLALWRDEDVFRKSIQRRLGRPEYVFYEGPPTANGRPGIHHVLARVFKDLFPRYKTMQGFYCERKGGWDTHGLPVELEVEKELGFTGKKDIEAFGIAAFNARCKDSVFRYVKQWEEMTDRIGFWVDTENAYVTYDNGYIESEWWILKQFWDRGLIYQDYKVTPHCPRCGTSLSSHEVSLGYGEADDPSVFVRFTFVPGQTTAVGGLTNALSGTRPVSLLVWTTTPWTLPANVAVAVNTAADYAMVEAVRDDGTSELLIVAAALAERLVPKGREVARFAGQTLLGLRYQRLFPGAELEKPAFRIVSGDSVTAAGEDEGGAQPFVSLDEGTGAVHLAPAYGAVDLEVGRAEGLPVLHTVNLRGEVTGVDPRFDGMFAKTADPVITEVLRERGILYRAERYQHRYPFCWRCTTPLLYYAKTSWYVRTSSQKEGLLRNNEAINWKPEHIKRGRFGNWLENNVDWAISRERYWGTPIPIFVCAGCGRRDCVGSVAELEQRSGRAGELGGLDLHRPFVDDITLRCADCGGEQRRIPDVLDCWFDSGAMPVAQWHAPFDNAEVFGRRFPADFICEAIDQTRGWFYSLHAISTLLYGEQSYRNVICLGHILDGNGEKMSKSRGNVVNPWDVLGTQGADALRWYLYTASPPGNSRRFSAELVDQVIRKFMSTLWNTYSFFVTYANLDGWTPAADSGERTPMDRWILARLHETIDAVTRSLDSYEPTDAGRAIESFVDDLSNWYVRRSRRRFWKSESDQDKAAAYSTLYTCLLTTATLLAPFTPFLAEELFQNLAREQDPSALGSVHLQDWPTVDEGLFDRELLAEFAALFTVISLGRAAREKAQIKVRQPLGTLFVRPPDSAAGEMLARLALQALEELNIKDLALVQSAGQLFDISVKPRFDVLGPRFGKRVGEIGKALAALSADEAASLQSGATILVSGEALGPGDVVISVRERDGVVAAEERGYVVGISTVVTPELASEGLAREIVHAVQSLRRDQGFEIADRIRLSVVGSAESEGAAREHEAYIAAETLAVIVSIGTPLEGAEPPTPLPRDFWVAAARA